MAIIQAVTTSFTQQLLQAGHNFSEVGGDTYKLALYSSSADLGPQTTVYTSTGEISVDGYTAGGATLTNLGVSSAGTTGFASFDNVTWSGAIVAAGALIYNVSSVAFPNASVCVLSFGMTRYHVSGTFTVSFPANNNTNAIIRINAPLA